MTLDWKSQIFDSLPFPMIMVGPDRTLVGANPAFYEKYGACEAEIIGKKCFEVFLYKQRTPCDSATCPIIGVLRDGKTLYHTVKYQYKWEERCFSPVGEGKEAHVLLSIRDITRTKSLEYQLSGAREFITRIIDASASAIVAADRNGRIELMNSVARELFGAGFGQGTPFITTQDLYPDGKAREIMKMLRDEKICGRGKLIISRIHILNAEKQKIPVEMSAAIIYDEGGDESATMAIYNDLADKSKVEKQLRLAKRQLVQSEKMASLGQLAAGVAHELNNPLTGVLFYASLLLEQGELSQEAQRDLEYIVEDANRCKNIVKSLLVYSRSTDSKKNIVHINEVVKTSLKLIRDQKKFRNIRIRRLLNDEMMLVNADTSKLNQVVINLVMNAADAIQGEGTISLFTYKNRVNRKVFLEIKDTGGGISRSDLARIFEPFFSTKAVEKSTGLGLSIVAGIIEEHGGSINVKATGKKGTTFIVELPLYLPDPGLCGAVPNISQH